MSNEDQAEKCVDIAVKAMNEKDWSKAERFLDKSIKLSFSNKAQNLLYKLDTMRRRDADDKVRAESAPKTPQNEPEKEPETPKYTAV